MKKESPAPAPRGAADTAHTAAGAAAPPPVLVVVVEDDPGLREILGSILEDSDFAVRAFASGRGALRAVTEHRPALILLDYRLADMDADEFVRLYRQMEPDPAPIVLATSLPEPDADAALAETGAAALLPKPFTPDALVALVRRITRP